MYLSGAKNAKEWHDWYENLGATMSAAQSIILCLICRMFVSNVFHTYLSERRRLDADLLKRLEDDDQTPEQTQQIDSPDSTTKEEEVQPDTTKDTQEIEEQTIPDVPAILDCVPQFCPSTGKNHIIIIRCLVFFGQNLRKNLQCMNLIFCKLK